MLAPKSLSEREFHIYLKESGPAIDAAKEAAEAAKEAPKETLEETAKEEETAEGAGREAVAAVGAPKAVKDAVDNKADGILETAHAAASTDDGGMAVLYSCSLMRLTVDSCPPGAYVAYKLPCHMVAYPIPHLHPTPPNPPQFFCMAQSGCGWTSSSPAQTFAAFLPLVPLAPATLRPSTGY